jgi:hypothetical protein
VTSARGVAARTFAERWPLGVVVVDVSRPSAGGEAFLRHAPEAGGLGPVGRIARVHGRPEGDPPLAVARVVSRRD